MRNKSVVAVVVTYNRRKLLKECINSLLNQNEKLDKIIVIDNASNDNTQKYLKKLSNKKEIIKNIRMNKNIGGAGGFNKGIKEAIKFKPNWVWIMDDDAEPSEDCLKNLLKDSDKKNDIGIICPLIKHKFTGEVQWYHHKRLDKKMYKDYPINKYKTEGELFNIGLVKLNANAFVGPLINSKLISEYGFPEKEYFIWSDDLEYTYRLSQKEGCYLSTNSIIYHKDNNINPNTGKVNLNTIWKQYYGIRNRILFIRKHQKSFHYRIIYYTKTFFNSFRKSLSLLLKYKIGLRSLIPLKGFWDGIRGKKGFKVKPFKIE